MMVFFSLVYFVNLLDRTNDSAEFSVLFAFIRLMGAKWKQ